MPSTKVTLNGKVIAESDQTIIVEGNHCFPPESTEFFTENDRHTTCHWKGIASFNLGVDGQGSRSAAWTYRPPSDDAERIKD